MMISLAPHRKRMSRCASALAIAVAWSLCSSGNALAQQENELRGTVQERAVTDELLNRSGNRTNTSSRASQEPESGSQSGLDSPPYQPATEAIGTALSDPLTDQPSRQDIFPDDILSDPASANVAAPAATAAARETASERRTSPLQTRPAMRSDEELTTGTVRADRLDTLDEERNERDRTENPRTNAIDDIARTPDDNPYGPLGLRIGSFVATSTLEQGIGWTSNATSSPGGRQAVFSETALRLNAISDWSRHSASISADGAYRKSLSGQDISEAEGGVAGELRLDLGNEFSATGSLGYRIRPESASSPVIIDDIVSQPLRQTFSGGVGLSKDVGKLLLAISGDVTRDTYGDAKRVGGDIVSQKERDSTLATVSLRAGYEISPALRPFAEIEIGRRFYDLKLDSKKYERSSDRYGLRAGVELDLGDKLRGEMAAGWLTERPDDDRLAPISGLSLGGNLAWSPVRGTTVELNGSTTVEGTTEVGKSGSLLYSGSLALRRELRSDLTGRALVGLDFRDYANTSDSETILRGEASLTWWMNRYAGVTGRARHEIQRSSLDGRDYDATSVYLGMTLQR